MPVASSIHWKPLRDSHYVIASLQPGQGGFRQIFITQTALMRIRQLAQAKPAEELLGLLIGQRWDCPLSGARWLLIESLVEGVAAVPDASTLTADLGALLGRRRSDGAECVGWYCGTTSAEAQLTRTITTVHGATFGEPWQTSLVLANAGRAGTFFLNDVRNARWFQAPFFEVTETPRNSRHQPAQPTAVSWPDYITAAQVAPVVIAQPVAPTVPPARVRSGPVPERARPVRVEVVVDAKPPEPTTPLGEATLARVRDASARLTTAGTSARAKVGDAATRVGQTSSAVSQAVGSRTRAVTTSLLSLGRRVSEGAAAAIEARKARAAEARRERAERDAEARRRQEEHARHAAERRAREEAARAAKQEAERAARVEAERIARENAERVARENAERSKAEAERARLEAERAAQERAERAEREAALEAERRAQREADQRARLEAAERARVEAERAQLEAAERARLQALERARMESAERARLEAAERARVDAERRARDEAAERARAEAAERARAEAAERARREAERRASAPPAAAPTERAVPRVVAKERTAAPATMDIEDTTAGDGPYRYLALARREGFQVSAKLERGTPDRPETVWLLNETESGLRLTVVTTDEEVREASLHYNLRTDDDALLRITPPEHRDVESRTIYVREPCIAELRSRCRRLRATGALAREWKVTPSLHPSAVTAQYR